MIFDEYLQVNLVGTDHQREVGILGLNVIFSGGFITEAQGFWLDDPREDNTIVRCWCEDLDSLAPSIIRFLRAYQVYASQIEIFFEVGRSGSIRAGSIDKESWNTEALELLDRGEYLAKYFQK